MLGRAEAAEWRTANSESAKRMDFIKVGFDVYRAVFFGALPPGLSGSGVKARPLVMTAAQRSRHCLAMRVVTSGNFVCTSVVSPGSAIDVVECGPATGERVVFEARAAQGEMMILKLALCDIRDARLGEPGPEIAMRRKSGCSAFAVASSSDAASSRR